MPDSEAAAAAFLSRVLGKESPELHDSAALEASLSWVEGEISIAEADVVSVVEHERESVVGVLDSADELRAELDALREGVHALPYGALCERLQSSVLRVPELRRQLDSSRAELAQLRGLADTSRLLKEYDAAIEQSELGRAAVHLRGVRRQLGALESHDDLRVRPHTSPDHHAPPPASRAMRRQHPAHSPPGPSVRRAPTSSPTSPRASDATRRRCAGWRSGRGPPPRRLPTATIRREP